MSSPPAVNAANTSAYLLSGTCSENGRTVDLRFDDGGGNRVNESALCGMGSWDQTADLSILNDGSITITANHSDDSSNDALQASITIAKDATLPTVAITPSTSINLANVSAYNLAGTCSENGRAVGLRFDDGGGSQVNESPLCSMGAWDQTTDLSVLSDGSITITADHSDDSSNDALQAGRTVIKDTILPTVGIMGSPPAVNVANTSAYLLSGTCSENGRAVGLHFDDGGGNQVNESPLCSMGAWDQTTDLSALSDGSITITANHSDDSSNDALQASNTVIKDTILPTVGIMSSPPVINAANTNAYLLSGTCSENGRAVSLRFDDGGGNQVQ